MNFFERKHNRREFIARCARLAVALGVSNLFIPNLAEAIEEAPPRPIIWLEGLSCSACSSSVLNSDYPSASSLLLDDMSLFFHRWIMEKSGEDVYQAIFHLASDYQDKFILILEGAFPGGNEDDIIRMGTALGKKIVYSELVIELARNAQATIAVGSCASFGGFPSMGPAKGQAASKYIENTKVINIPGCPAHPDWITSTALHIFAYGTNEVLSDLDELNRPKAFYQHYVHDQCSRRAAFDEGRFLEDYNNPEQAKNYCLLKQGCKGIKTKSDCPERLWNSRQNYCIQSGAPCLGCTEPDFPEKFMPFNKELSNITVPGVFGVKAGPDQAAIILAAGSAAGMGVHLLGRKIRKNKKDKGENDTGSSDKSN